MTAGRFIIRLIANAIDVIERVISPSTLLHTPTNFTNKLATESFSITFPSTAVDNSSEFVSYKLYESCM